MSNFQISSSCQNYWTLPWESSEMPVTMAMTVEMIVPKITMGLRVTCQPTPYYVSFSCLLRCSLIPLLSIPVISEKHSISRFKQLNQFHSSQANHNHLNVIAALTERPQRAKTSSILSLLLAFIKTQRVVLQLAEARTYSALWNSDA